MRNRRAGGYIGIIVIAAYLLLRFGFVAYREHEEGMSTGGIVLSLVVFAALILGVSQLVLWIAHARTGARERALQGMHPTAYLVPVSMKRDLVAEIQRAQSMLGLPGTTVPRRGFATLVADGNGVGLYAGGAQPELVLGLNRAVVAHVGTGRTRAGGRYAIGTVDALQLFVSNGQHWTTVDLPVYKRVLGYARTLHGEELDAVVQRVASAAGIAVAPAG